MVSGRSFSWIGRRSLGVLLVDGLADSLDESFSLCLVGTPGNLVGDGDCLAATQFGRGAVPLGIPGVRNPVSVNPASLPYDGRMGCRWYRRQKCRLRLGFFRVGIAGKRSLE